MRRLKNLRFESGKGRRGFTLIELLIVMAILSILAGTIVLSVGTVFATVHETAYDVSKHEIQNAVVGYQAANAGSVPVTGATVDVSGSEYRVIDICALASLDGMLRKVPAGCTDLAGDDNCAGGCDCFAESHYIWLVDSQGNVMTKCEDNVANGGGCLDNSADGFQGIWP